MFLMYSTEQKVEPGDLIGFTDRSGHVVVCCLVIAIKRSSLTGWRLVILNIDGCVGSIYAKAIRSHDHRESQIGDDIKLLARLDGSRT